ncbi:MAG: type Z 30S ribosomal protein S14 [Candidatus Omnitrophica bacterium]|nr:type Z 30S ribosomal protein S14 [Candidatus Omnitrophota bacterium]
MAKNSQIARWKRKPKFSTRQHNRCAICGRSGGYLRRFQLCRLCFRELAWLGVIPGVKKASW